MSTSPREALIILNLVPGLGSVRIKALLDFFGSAELVLHAPKNLLGQVQGIGPKVAAAIADWQNCTNLEEELRAADYMGVRLITLMDEEYPPALRRMSDPPVVLYARGASMAEGEPRAVSVVGPRLATPYGMTAARRISRELSEAGCTIISGLARGIDAAAHWGALDAGGRTVGILGSGHACFFPSENEELALAMIERAGTVISEFPMHMRPSKTSFPQRNRIVAAMSEATFVIEAPNRSGALHTARISGDEYGNHLFAMPGSIDWLNSVGCHALIRDGATLCTSAQQLLADMRWEGSHSPQPAPSPRKKTAISLEYYPLIEAIKAGNDTLDTLCSSLGMAAHELNPLLMRMQIEGLISAAAGARFKVI